MKFDEVFFALASFHPILCHLLDRKKYWQKLSFVVCHCQTQFTIEDIYFRVPDHLNFFFAVCIWFHQLRRKKTSKHRRKNYSHYDRQKLIDFFFSMTKQFRKREREGEILLWVVKIIEPINDEIIRSDKISFLPADQTEVLSFRQETHS